MKRLPIAVDPSLIEERPQTRADCHRGIRPCPWLGCRYHLLEVREHDNGRIEIGPLSLPADSDRAAVERFTDDVAELVATREISCTLDVAERDGATLDHVGKALGLTRERCRQIETSAMRHLKPRTLRRGLR